MDPDEARHLIMRNLVPIFLGIVGLFLILLGVYQVFESNKNSEPGIVFEENKEEEESVEIIVDVEGAVIEPGVYALTTDKRIVDALAKAGGLSENADRDFVEKNINLAGKLTDGLKIYIPRVGEEVLADNNQTNTAAGPVININLASMSDLDSLPGVGEVTAQKIIDARPFASVDELLSRNIVGNATFEKIKDKIAAN